MADPADTDAVAELFGEAVDLPPAGRRAYVEAAGAEEAVRREVLSLLDAHEQARSVPERIDPARVATMVGDDSPVPAAAGRHIGPYRIVRELGRGGMGVVYLAERADGAYEQRVALKILPTWLRSDAQGRRFLRERQILARLEHPGIARLLDGGVADDGEPYFVLEYVAGDSLTRWCDEHRLGIDERLRLFLRVCDAVQYAHRGLVVHRDLKPSNILVTPVGEVKLLDFGIAKLLSGGEEAEATALTRASQRPLTPGYAAPEQHRGEPVTTATDVYSLGVVLYELLVGRRLHSAEAVRRLGTAATSSLPTRPSAAVQTAARGSARDGPYDPDAAARARGTRADRLRRSLRGDLDTIVLQALREEPERRYGSVEALAADIRSHLHGHPVSARPASVGYRANRYLRRHRVGVAATLLVVLALLGGLATTAYQAREKAREAAKAEEVKDFLASLFTSSDPNESRGEALTARGLLDRGMERIDLELGNQPAVLAEMLDLIGDLYTTLDVLDEAESALTRGLDLRRTLHGARHTDVAESLFSLGRLHFKKGDVERAETLYRRALTLRRSLLGVQDPEVASTLVALTAVLLRQGRFDDAEAASREALNIRRRQLGPEHPDVAESMHWLARALHKRGAYTEETDSLFRRALMLQRRHYGELHTAVVLTMENHSLYLQDAGRLDEAERQIRRAARLTKRLRGEESLEVANTLHNLGRLLHFKGDHRGAESQFRHALQIYRTLLGEDHTHVAVTLHDIGVGRMALDDPDGAEPLLRESLRIYRARFGNEHHYAAMSLNRLGYVHQARGEPTQAERLFRESLSIYRKTLPDRHPFTGTSLLALGSLLATQRRAAEAEPLLREVELSWSAAFSADDKRLLEARRELARCLADLNRSAEARAILQAIYPLHRATFGDEHASTILVRETLARLDGTFDDSMSPSTTGSEAGKR